MKFTPKKLLPSLFELVSLLFLAGLIVFLGNSNQLLAYYGLDSSKDIIRSNAGSAVTTGLTKLDGFSLTGQLVTFLIWALVGVFCLTIVRAIANVYHEIELDQQLSTNRYVHPTTFTRAKFWKQVLLDFIVLIVLLALSGVVLYGIFAFALPIGLAYSRTFLVKISVPNLGNLLIGLATIYVGLVLLDFCIRLLGHRRQFTWRL